MRKKTKNRHGAFGLQVLMLMLVMLIGGSPQAWADRMKDNDYFKMYWSGNHDHVHFSLQAADLVGQNTYSRSGTIKATCGGTTYEILKIHSTGSGKDSGDSWKVYGYDPNGSDWGGVCYITNISPSGEQKVDRGDSDNSYTVKKGEKDDYPTIEIDFYWPASMAGKQWEFKYEFYLDQNDRVAPGDQSMKLGNYHLGYTAADFGYKTVSTGDFKYERTAIDKISFEAPELPSGAIPSKLSDFRWYKAYYNLTFNYTMPSGEVKSVVKNELECKSQRTKYEIEIPVEYMKFKRLDLKAEAVVMLMNADDKYYWQDKPTHLCSDIFANPPQPKGLAAEYRQFDDEAILTWEAFSKGDKFLHGSVPYVYRIETKENGTPLSGESWKKLGTLDEVSTRQQMTFTDNNVSSGTYYRYMVLNVPKDWIGHGVSQTDLNSPDEDLLMCLPYTESAVVNTRPQVTLFDLQQDLTHTTEVRLTWKWTRVPVKAQNVTFTMMRRTSPEEGWTVYSKDISGPSNPKDGEVGSFVDQDLPNNKVRYDYRVVLELNEGKDNFSSDLCTAGLIEGTTVKGIEASKGTHAGTVRVTWNSKQVGTGSNTYMLYRRYADTDDDFGKPIYTTTQTAEQYTYEDHNALPGYYYEYKVEIYGDGGTTYQNALTDVGFCQARGVVNGNITFKEGNTAVENVRIDLVASDDDGTSMQGYSKRFDGASAGVQWKADSTELAKVFGPDKDFTMQMFVRPDSLLNAGAVIGEIPGEGRLVLGSMKNGEYDLALQKVSYGSVPVGSVAVDSVVVDSVLVDSVKYEPQASPLPASTKTTDLSTLTGDYTAQNLETLTGKLGGNYKISIADGAVVFLKDVIINGTKSKSYKWAGINCPGDATLVLEGNNTVKGFYEYYPGIHIAEGKTLTIKGTGSLTASSNGWGTGIGGGWKISCGNIVIEGGTIKATALHEGAGIGGCYGAPCGNILIKGGTIEATGGLSAAGIGSGYLGSCGNIVIEGGTITASGGKNGAGIGSGNGGSCGSITITSVDKLTVNRGAYARSIGKGPNGTCGPVTIGGTVYPDGINEQDYTISIIKYRYIYRYIYKYYGYIYTNVAIPSNKYSLLTVSRTISKTESTLSFQVDGGEVKTLPATKLKNLAPFSVGGADSLKTEQGFKGNITEVRVWDHVLTDAEKRSYADRMLNGSEKGLKLYWPMDEGLDLHVFDASYAASKPNGRHATVGASVSNSVIVPTQEQLSRYGMTNSTGEYTVRGIPFAGSGTTYRVVPQLGVHEFDPATTTLFFSPNSPEASNINFKDKSSFPMEGYVYYAGTNIPVEGVMFYIDNQLVTGQGESKQTDANGRYSISVPIGKHYVEARKDGHTFVAGGRYPTANTFNFDRAVTYDFADATLVNFVGRVAGGERNDSLPVGFAQSVNNIGMATVTLRLTNESFSFNCADDHISQAAAGRTWASDTASVKSRAWTGTGDESRFIHIRTDSLTGEFSALLPPLKYTIKSVTLLADDKALADNDENTNPSGIEFITGQEVDMTQAKASFADTLVVTGDKGAEEKRPYHYNAKKVFTHFAQPTLDIVERNNGVGVFGLRAYSEVDAQGDTLKIDNLWTLDQDGNPKYLLDYPVYQMGDRTEFRFTAYEEYVNRDGKAPVVQHIPLSGQVVNAINEMADDQSIIYTVDTIGGKNPLYREGDVYNPKTHGCTLDDYGQGIYKWGAGLPNITSPYTRHLTVSMQRNGRTYILREMDAIVLGNITLGNNFVTKGPDCVDFVLRDPPGAKSKTTLKRAKITRTETLSSGGFYDKSSALSTWMLGMNVGEGEGVLGWMIITGKKVKYDLKAGVNSETTMNSLTEETTTTTYSNAISTSAATPYINSPGDVYVGTSTNILVGQCRMLHIVKQKDKADKYGLQVDMARAFGSTVSTNFMFSQYELQKVMIPKWKDQRNGFMATAREVSDSVAAYAYTNTDSKAIYVRWNKPGDPDYGVYRYRWIAPDPDKVKEPEVDSVAWCTNQIKAWEETIRSNEEDKVKSMQVQDGFKNYSLDGGSTYTFAERVEKMTVNRTTTNWKVGAVVGTDFGHQSSVWGVNFNISSENGKQWTDGSGNDEGDYTEWEYTLQDGNRDTDISINQYDPQKKNWSKVFSVFGGQTYNPYHAADSTIYYTPKTQLNAATERMEQPDMGVSLDGNTPQKNITVTDIPAGGDANLTLHCTNLATAHQGVNFSYNLVVVESSNKNGLQILMDGVPINGRSIMLNQSETTLKRITIRQTDQSLLTYEGIKLRFCSQYQPNIIYDEVTINAYFKPWSSDIDLVIDSPVLNTQSEGGRLDLRLKNFNREFQHLKKVGVEYRFEGNTQWNSLHTWWTSEKDTIGPANDLLPQTNDIRYAVDMESNLAYPEGTYEFRAFTTTPYDHEEVSVYSDVVTVIKDLTRPRNLFTPAPANGILGYGDQMAIEFNEDIVPGYVSDKNVIVTAKLNSEEVMHDVAYQLMPFGVQPKTVNPVFLKGDFSVDFWLNWHIPGTIMHIGKSSDEEDAQGSTSFELSINSENCVEARVAGATFTSDKTLPADTWTFMALSFNAADMTFNMLAQHDTVTINVFPNMTVPIEVMQAVGYNDDNHLYLGKIFGEMHGLSLYNICRDVRVAAAEKYLAKDNYVYGLANYWPMDEGHGTVAADTRHTHNFTVDDSWILENKSYSLRIDDAKGAQANISTITTNRGDSYAIEMWYERNGNTGEVIFETAIPTSAGDLQDKESKLRLHFDSLQNMVLDYGLMSHIVASHEDFPNLLHWHHVALNVVRGQAASFYLDGQRTAVIPEADMPPLKGAALVIGKDNNGMAFADELRIWHAALSESRLLNNMYNAIDTADVYSRGLVAYYPFEKAGEENGVATKVPTMENMSPKQKSSNEKEMNYHANALFGNTPPLKNAPDETRLIASPVASERKVVINLTGTGVTPRQLEGTTLNITVDQIHDMHGNTSMPIRWTAYVQRNTLKWMKDSVNVFKKYGEDYTFDVDIENKSGSTEYYTLYNMPQWLSLVDSERSDDVSPLRTKTLRFRVNPLTPVGNYDATIGLQGNNGIQEPMRIVMKVRGERPQWAVDPTKYEHQMNIVGQVYINGILMENAESMVAAFIGDECRGVASPERVRGAAYVTMTVYGKDTRTADMGKTLSFRIWDATQGVAYTDAQIAVDGSPIDITFQQDRLIGNFDHPAIWTKSENVEQLIPVHLNWNWIAFGVVPKSPYLDHIFADYADWQLLIKDRTLFSDYNGAEWNGTLQPVANAMYKLRIDRLPTTKKEAPNSLLAVSGRQLKENAERAVTLSKGWNWIAYTPLTTMTVDEALAAANPQTGDIVKSQTGMAIYGPYGWEGSLKALEGGHGYLYFTNDSTGKSFLYPAASSASAKARMAAPRRAAEEDELRIFHPVELGLYPSNMTMVIRLMDGTAPVDTAEVGAFIGDECRGAARASSRGLYYLVISGEGAGQPMTLRSCIDGQIIDIDTSLMYVSDDNIGTSWEPYVIDLSRILTGIIAVDGSPTDDDSDWYTLQGFKIGRKPTQPGVYIHRGEKVMIKRAK